MAILKISCVFGSLNIVRSSEHAMFQTISSFGARFGVGGAQAHSGSRSCRVSFGGGVGLCSLVPVLVAVVCICERSASQPLPQSPWQSFLVVKMGRRIVLPMAGMMATIAIMVMMIAGVVVYRLSSLSGETQNDNSMSGAVSKRMRRLQRVIDHPRLGRMFPSITVTNMVQGGDGETSPNLLQGDQDPQVSITGFVETTEHSQQPHSTYPYHLLFNPPAVITRPTSEQPDLTGASNSITTNTIFSTSTSSSPITVNVAGNSLASPASEGTSGEDGQALLLRPPSNQEVGNGLQIDGIGPQVEDPQEGSESTLTGEEPPVIDGEDLVSLTRPMEPITEDTITDTNVNGELFGSGFSGTTGEFHQETLNMREETASAAFAPPISAFTSEPSMAPSASPSVSPGVRRRRTV